MEDIDVERLPDLVEKVAEKDELSGSGSPALADVAPEVIIVDELTVSGVWPTFDIPLDGLRAFLLRNGKLLGTVSPGPHWPLGPVEVFRVDPRIFNAEQEELPSLPLAPGQGRYEIAGWSLQRGAPHVGPAGVSRQWPLQPAHFREGLDEPNQCKRALWSGRKRPPGR